MSKKPQIQAMYPLSPMQEGMLSYWLLAEDSIAYQQQMTLTFRGQLDIELFERSFQLLIERYDPLRTIFVYQKVEQPVQVVLTERSGKVSFKDLSLMPLTERKEHLGLIKAQERGRKYDLSKDMLMRLSIVRTETELYQVIWSYHHILMDGWCLGILINDFLKIYAALAAEQAVNLEPVVSYREYINWLETRDTQAAVNYWQHYLRDYEELTGIPIQQEGDQGGYLQQESSFLIDEELFTELTRTAEEQQVTVNTILQTIWGILLQRYNQTSDVIFGSVVSGRPAEIVGIERMVGLFINTIPVRIRTGRQMTCRALLQQVQESAVNSTDRDFLPLAEIQAKSELKQHLFDHILVFENYPVEKTVVSAADEKLPLRIIQIEKLDQTNYNLNLLVLPDDGLSVTFKYNALCYQRDFVQRMAGHFLYLIQQLVKNPDLLVDQLKLVTREEELVLLTGLNGQQADYPVQKTINQLFAEQAARTPERIALVYQDQELTYQEVNCRANQLARLLRSKGVQSEQLVGIMVERCCELMIGIIAILKAGGGYLPIDVSFPTERIEFMLTDSQTKVLLSSQELNDQLTFTGERLNLFDAELYAGDDSNLEELATADNLAYVIYTSGSTGRPKGVLVEHGNVVRLMVNSEHPFDFCETDVWTLFHSCAFDFSVWEMYGALLYGGTLVIVPKLTAQNPTEFLQLLKLTGVTVLNQTPTAFYNLSMEDLQTADKDLQLRYVIFGGEALKPLMLKGWRNKYPSTRLINMFGITETTVHVTYKEITTEEIEQNVSNIGKAIPTLSAYVMDANLELLPWGIPGELCVGGLGVSRGYLNRGELTAEKFVFNPYIPGERLYRSGDLVQMLASGELKYLGRIDRQVKIRGFRIELAEIEKQILKIPEIQDVVVIDREDLTGDKFLTAYLVSEQELPIDQIRKSLADQLPDYMLPAYFVRLKELPLTDNGKVDLQALPEPTDNLERSREYVAPTNDVEARLVEIWSQLLGIEQIGITDDFFALGGHSLKATRLAARVFKEFDTQLPLQEIFARSTIRELALMIGHGEVQLYPPIEQADQREYYPVSSAQKRLLILHQLKEVDLAYNMPGMMEIRGDLDLNRLEEAFLKLIKRHEALRTSFTFVDGEPMQRIHREVSFAVQILQLDREAELEELLQSFIQPFDLGQPPLLRVSLVKRPGDWLLLYDLHHIISDGMSMEILIKEFIQLYQGQSLKDLRIQYKDFAVWQNELFVSGLMQRQQTYWQEIFAGQLPVLELPTDFLRPAIRSSVGARYNFQINSELKDKLEQLITEKKATLFMVLLAAYNILLAKYSAQDDIIVGSPIAGRVHLDLEPIIGLFVNTLALRNQPVGTKSFTEFLTEVKERTLQAYEHQDYPLELLLEELSLQRDLSRNPLFDTMLVLQNMDLPFNEELESGLSFKPVQFDKKISKFDLTLAVWENNQGGLGCMIEYCTALFTPAAMQRLARQFRTILVQIVEQPEQLIGKISLLSKEDMTQLLISFNQTEERFSPQKTLDQLFTEQAEQTPEAIAVEFQDSQLTYRELEQKVNQLAKVLRQRGVVSEQVVGLITQRSLNLSIGILGILKSGGTYLPIDPSYPEERIEYFLQDCAVRLVLNPDPFQNNQFKSGRQSGIQTIDLDDPLFSTAELTDLPERQIQPDQLAYIIYTSGSTGKPKGVMTEHRGIVNTVQWRKTTFELTPADRVLQIVSFSFDASMINFFTPLVSGARIVIPTQEEAQDVLLLKKIIASRKITNFNCIPVLFVGVLEAAAPGELATLRVVALGGDQVSSHLVELCKQKHPQIRLINEYGPTESSVMATAQLDLQPKRRVSIGKPIANTQVFILDEYEQLVAIGVPGELYIGGAGLARGYVNRPELTTELFVPNPYFPELTIYKTGDRARWLANGEIEFLGRIDQQVKIRGYRIEPGEIENILLSQQSIVDVLVIARDELGTPYLCAYIVARERLVTGELRTFLAKQLPDYMIPAYFVQLEEFPLSSSGKVNLQALPIPEEIGEERRYIAPTNEIEAGLAQIWVSLLHQKRISLNDNFFALGGDSLKGTKVVLEVFKEFGVELPLKEIFQRPTIKELAHFIYLNRRKDFTQIKHFEEREYYPASYVQKRFYMLRTIAGQVSLNMPEIIRITGKLDIRRLEKAFQQVIGRHAALRTGFEIKDDQILQRVYRNVRFRIKYSAAAGRTEEQIIEDFVQPFDLSQPPLLKVEVVKLTAEEYLFLYDMDHIISDGVSMGILAREVIEIYGGAELAEPGVQYPDYTLWQQDYLQSWEIRAAEEYWLGQFADEIPQLNLPTDFKRPANLDHRGEQIHFELDEELTREVEELVAAEQATLFIFILTIYNILLARYSGQEDIVIGTPVAGRVHPDLQNTMGVFINTLALRNRPTGGLSFAEFLTQVKENTLQAFDYQGYQYEMLIDKLGVAKDWSRNALFDALLIFQNIDQPNTEELQIGLGELEFRSYSIKNKTAQVDLMIGGHEFNQKLGFNLVYATQLFTEETIERFARHFRQVIGEVVANPGIKLSEIQLLSTQEKERILYQFNQTTSEYEKTKTINQLFAEQALKTPDSVALIYRDQQLTYGELNTRANQLAIYLREQGLQVDEPLGLIVKPSLEMVIGMLGVLKAGGAYLPIDLKYPRERIEYILRDSQVRFALTRRGELPELEYPAEIFDLTEPTLYSGDGANLVTAADSSHLAYIIYTSGSTGKPKGVMVEHGNLAAYIHAFNTEFRLNSSDVVLQQGSFSFDASVEEIYPVLTVGGRVVIFPRAETIDLELLVETIQTHSVTLISCSPLLLNELNDLPELDSVYTYISGGDVLKSEYITKLLRRGDVYNTYGPTETTVCACYYKCTNPFMEQLPIGKPIANYRIYVLDSQGNLAPIGVPGELCIAGDGLTRGYLHRPELTAEKYTTLAYIPGERIYRTGDLVRWRADGNIEFLGRIDQQVKIRGYRIELAEIEAELLTHWAIKEVAVIAQIDTTGNKSLTAYIVTKTELTVQQLREYLGEKVPEYMIPAYFIPLDRLPVTVNGKLNRQALPALDGRINTGTEYVAATDEIGRKLTRIWAEILGLKAENIGIYDNFFALGGHSLSATHLAAQIYKEFNVDISLIQVFQSSTIEQLAGYILEAEKAVYTSIELVPLREFYPVSSAQKRLFILNELESEQTTAYNIPGAMLITETVDHQYLEGVLQALIERHESLRTSFEFVNGEPVQRVHPDLKFQLEYLEGKEEEFKELIAEFIRPFNLRKAPLFRARLVKAAEKRFLLIFDLHHIIADGTSIDLLLADFSRLFVGEELLPVKVQYKDFTIWQNKLFASEMIKRQERYWLEHFKGELPVLNLPTDRARPAVMSFLGERVSFNLSEQLTHQLRELAFQQGATLYMILLAIYNLLLFKYTAQEDIIVGTPIAGRPHPELAQTMGMFANTLAMRNQPRGDETFVQFLAQVKENALQAFKNQDYQFEMLVDRLDLKRDLSRNPLFDTMFALQNTARSVLEADQEGKITPFEFANQTAKFDLLLDAFETNNGIIFELDYSTELFRRETIERLIQHFLQIIDEVIANPESRLQEIQMISEPEREQLIWGFNRVSVGQTFDSSRNGMLRRTIHQLFAEQAEKTPGQTALVFAEVRLSYREVNQRANQLAHFLRHQGFGVGQIAGIMLRRSPELIIHILAVLKAGGAYLPIDPELPINRIKLMLEDSGVGLLLTNEEVVKLNSTDWTELSVELLLTDLQADEIRGEVVSNPSESNTCDDLLYLISTSGSTGRPKSVMVEHRNLVNLLNFQFRQTNIDFSRVLQFTTISFDVSAQEIFSTLLTGGQLYLISQEIRDNLPALFSLIETEEITTLFLPMAILKFIFTDTEYLRSFPGNVKHIVTAGEQVIVNDAFRRYLQENQVYLHNHYGPSETHVVTSWTADFRGAIPELPPIGKPIENTRIYVLDPQGRPQPIGVVGELYIAGESVGRGYYQRPELTAESFAEDPFVPGARMYRTGDLARWLADGNLEFRGRKDQQVKVRGFRIELGEIESQLLNHGLIKEVAVTTETDQTGTISLAAYYAAERELEISELRGYLARVLPDYMIPAYFVQLTSLPLTTSGKIDRQLLTTLAVEIKQGREYRRPTTELQAKLAAIWSEILRVEPIGVGDNFFELGGQSLKATQVVSRVYRELGVELALREIFRSPTIEELACHIEKSQRQSYSEIVPVETREYYPLSSAQQRLFILNQLEGEQTAYNMPGAILIEGNLDPRRLSETCQRLVKRHGALRTSFQLVNGEPVQQIDESVDFVVEDIKPVTDSIDQVMAQFVRPFNLNQAPLFRAALAELEGRYLFLWDIHHIISDGRSLAVLIRDFIGLYAEEPLPELSLEYRDFAVWQNQFLASKRAVEQEEYWLTRFADPVPKADQLIDFPRPELMSFEGADYRFQTNRELKDQILQLAKEQGATLYIILLTALNILLAKYSGQEDVVVGSPIVGRPRPELEEIIGIFVNTLAMRNAPRGWKTVAEFIDEVKENSLQAFENQEYQFEKLIERLGLRWNLSRNPLFDVVLVLQNIDNPQVSKNNLTFTSIEFENKLAKFDLTLNAVETSAGIYFNFEYRTRLFKRATIEQLAADYLQILRVIVDQRQCKLSEIELRTNVQKLENTRLGAVDFDF